MTSDKSHAPRLMTLRELLEETPPEIAPAESLAEFLELNGEHYKLHHLKSQRVWLDMSRTLCIEVDGAEDHYWIEKSRYKTAAQRWEWAQHLLEKTWFTPPLLWDMLVIMGRPLRRCDP